MTQEKALDILKAGYNVFLTGSAGTGKTYVLNEYIEYLRDRDVGVAVTASTGIAATHINGMTIHAWSGIGVRDYLSAQFLHTLKSRKYMKKKFEKAQVLIIDEISMLHKRQLDMVNEVCQAFKESDLPFGGMQVIFSGDFFQLPPVSREEVSSSEKFSFMSRSWVQAAPIICYLTEQYRQTKNSLNELLNQMRSGEVGEDLIQLVHEKVAESRYADEMRFPQLYTHNADVDRLNNHKIAELESRSEVYVGKKKGNATLSDMLMNNVLTTEKLELKIGAKVMFIRNNYDLGYFNGTLGEITDYSVENWPIVETKDGNLIEVKPEVWQMVEENGSVIASYTQVPLRLAWAITIHKSQGMTLNQATIDLRKTFERGQGYVALSRLRDFDGLHLLGINPMAMMLDELAHKADARFAELSMQADEKLSTEDLQKLHPLFITRSGGKIIKSKAELEEIRRAKHAAKQKPKKVSTFETTRLLLEEGLSASQIAEKRNLNINTIYGHFQRFKDTHAQLILNKIIVDSQVEDKVRMALENEPQEDREVKALKPIFEFLQEQVSYDDIRKVLLRIECEEILRSDL
ncbi:MAG: AAA family ATPase [Weeksellaceae bacterium]|nr:AAA family ATPase [Weeksellaceae bacterium]